MDAPALKFASENEKPGQLEAKPGFPRFSRIYKAPAS
jgi:hypothetical protein